MSNLEQAVVGTTDYHFTLRNEVFAQLEMQARRKLYRKRPDIWAKDILGVELWSKQVEVALSIVENKNTMVAAAHGVGKSYLTAVLACWWIDTHEVEDAIVLSTAPSSAQVRNIIWKQIQQFHRLSAQRYTEYGRRKNNGESTHGLPDHRLPGRVTSRATWMSDNNVPIGFGRTPPRGREGDAFQGIHGNVFAIADEAVGVSEDMIQTLANNTSNMNDRRLLIANPTNPLSSMGQTWNDPVKSKAWEKITISVFDSPKFTDEHKLLQPETLEHLVDQSYVDDKLIEYGEESANYIARVLGRWATDGGMNVFSEDALALARDVVVIPDEGGVGVRFGFDVARSEKGDWSHLYIAEPGWVYITEEWNEKEGDWIELKKPIKTEKRGLKIRKVDAWRGMPFQPTIDRAGNEVERGANQRVDEKMREYGAERLHVDADGMGRLMLDAMLNVSFNDYETVGIYGNDASPDRNTWYNQRAYQYIEFARSMRNGTIDIAGDDSILIEQLSGVEYKFAAGYANSILIESKQEMRKKGLKSPDAADAALYSFIEGNLDDSPDIGVQFDYNFDPIVDEFDHFYANSSW